jgi:hypothetical protein
MALYVRLRIDRVQRVIICNEEPAHPAMLLIRVEQLAVLAEDLNPMVAAVGDKEAALRVELEGVRRAELTRPEAEATPLLREAAESQAGSGNGNSIEVSVHQ